MSMISCEECKQPVSSYARVCPHCGYPSGAKIHSAVVVLTVIAGIVVFVVAMLMK